MSIGVKILIWILSAIVFFLGGYIWKHRKKPFITFHPEKNHTFSLLLTIMGSLLLLSGIITIIMSFTANLMLVITMILVDVALVSILSFILIGYAFIR